MPKSDKCCGGRAKICIGMVCLTAHRRYTHIAYISRSSNLDGGFSLSLFRFNLRTQRWLTRLHPFYYFPLTKPDTAVAMWQRATAYAPIYRYCTKLHRVAIFIYKHLRAVCRSHENKCASMSMKRVLKSKAIFFSSPCVHTYFESFAILLCHSVCYVLSRKKYALYLSLPSLQCRTAECRNVVKNTIWL